MLVRRGIGRDKDGGIEGLPLQLMIMVAIAGIGMAIILGWMTGLEAPKSIGAVYSSPTELVLEDDDGDGVYESDGISIVITVLDQNGDGVQGATVLLEGMNVVTSVDGKHVHGMTDDTGRVRFSGLSASQVGSSIGFVTVTVTKAGYGTDSNLTIPVIAA
ncbi:MAG: carboxypeptidase regulatory-like domain-containing protein [Euryarchaeota archaeon]|nr:carboxypeptidase regulatory-like domain-containing protein [Euryarchaeota archaeon]